MQTKEIDYSQIDELCIPMVQFFNSQGLTTKFCCQGHDNVYNFKFYIMFHESVTDEQLSVFLDKYENRFCHTPFLGSFMKWMRKCGGKMLSNWMYVVDCPDYATNQYRAEKDLDILKNNA